ncbi:histidine phosphatase family protein [Desmospora activa]|uniref:2,3-bisphosphoglycerate-dependent phosphoglycerate mutase n=1 Tax=Desmospora activa DSM 45169 TaxID=1121389 RepID=A0A2T4ZDG0_9BACL|nr:histidine phosphatase family protein [Desmospora activa]PTM59934.1 2,3-bisphosphoglycerate-dependent phosphoglycerate mutase [Desmospora activa DSM 45169]
MEWLLVRHGSAMGQEADAPLTEQGKWEAVALAEVLLPFQPDQVVTSPYRRAIDTIAPFVEQSGASLVVDDRLRERVLSAQPRTDWLQWLQASFADFDLSLTGGESNREAMQRAVSLLTEWEQSRANRVVIVTHGALLTLLLHHFDSRFGFETWKQLSNPDLYQVDVRNGQASVTRLWSAGNMCNMR